MNEISQLCFDRLQAALLPTKDSIKDFVLNKTRLNGRPFSLKDHEYQGKILELMAQPDIDIVIQKPSQTGVSEIIYRAMLGWAALIKGFSAAIVFPTRAMSNEVFSTRVSPIIDDSPPLKAIKNNAVDSNSVKMFLNNSILYALGASPTSKNTVINRPIRTIIADELSRCDIGVITTMRSRQRHQKDKSSVYFSTPLFEGADIDEEMNKCGVIWEMLLHCRSCGHQFFPDFYKHVRLPGFDDEIKRLRVADVEELDLDIKRGYLECPSCKQPCEHEAEDFTWVDTATKPGRPKVGVKLNAFCLPAYVRVPEMLADWLAYEDKVEFHQQVLGLPATKADTTMDVNQISFDSDAKAGLINVWGLDMGKICYLNIGTVTEECVICHTRIKIPLKEIRETVTRYVSEFNCLAGVVDFLPYSDIATEFVNAFPNTWAAQYVDPSTPIPELFKLKIDEDSDFGNVRFIRINKNLFFDTYVNELMNRRFIYTWGPDKSEILTHHEAMRRIRNPKFVELRYQWVKAQANKTVDHWFHGNVYLLAAARLAVKSTISALPIGLSLSAFKPKNEL